MWLSLSNDIKFLFIQVILIPDGDNQESEQKSGVSVCVCVCDEVANGACSISNFFGGTQDFNSPHNFFYTVDSILASFIKIKTTGDVGKGHQLVKLGPIFSMSR